MEEDIVKKVIVAVVVIGSLTAMGYGFYSIALKDDGGGSTGSEPTGGILPDMYFKDQYGERREIHDYKGKYLVVDMTGIECVWCPNQYENLTKIRNMYPQSQVQIISIEVWNQAGDWSVTMDKMARMRETGEISWIYGVDEYGDVSYRYGGSVPRIFVLDPQGYVIYEPSAGVVPWENIAQVLP